MVFTKLNKFTPMFWKEVNVRTRGEKQNSQKKQNTNCSDLW